MENNTDMFKITKDENMEVIHIFVSYSHENKEWVESDGKYHLIPWFKNQLQSENVVVWTDHSLEIGEKFEQEIKDNIEKANIAILLISQDFSVSDFILTKELPWILTRYNNGDIQIIPLLIEPVTPSGREKLKDIFEMQIMPDAKRSIITFFENPLEWANVKNAILEVIQGKIKKNRDKKIMPIWKKILQAFSILLVPIPFFLFFGGTGAIHAHFAERTQNNLCLLATKNVIEDEKNEILSYYLLDNVIVSYEMKKRKITNISKTALIHASSKGGFDQIGYVGFGVLLAKIAETKIPKMKGKQGVVAYVVIGISIACGHGVGYWAYVNSCPAENSDKMREFLENEENWEEIVDAKKIEKRRNSSLEIFKASK